MSFDQWTLLVITALTISVSPGAGALNSINNAMAVGFVRTIPSIFGLQLGWLVQIVVVATGVGFLIVSSPFWYEVLRWAGAIYLIILGLRQWSVKAESFQTSLYTESDRFAWRSFWQGVFIDLSNLKGTVLLIALIPAFLHSETNQLQQISIVASTLIVVDIVIMALYAWLASYIANAWQEKPDRITWVYRLSGSAMILIGVALALHLDI